MKDNPVSIGVAVAGPAVLGARVIAGGVGASANYGAQKLFGTEPTDWLDLGVASFTGFITGGASSWMQGLGAAGLVNVGGSLTGSAIKGENSNAGMGAAAVGTAVGYPIGKIVEVPFNKALNPWYRPDWIPAGLYGVTKPNPPSVIPGSAGGEEQLEQLGSDSS